MGTAAQNLSWSTARARGSAEGRAWREALGWALGTAAVLGAVAEAIRRYPEHALAIAAAAAALLLAAGAVLARPALGACALITLIYWNLSDVVTETWGFSWMLKLALAGVLGAWALQRTMASRRVRWHWPLALPVALYTLALGASATQAVNRPWAVGALEEYGRGIVMFYLIANLLGRPKLWRRGIQALLAGVALLSLPVVYQGLSGSQNTFWGLGAMAYDEISPGNWSWRLGGAIGDPNFLAMVLAAALPLALVTMLEPGAPRPRRLWGAAVAALTVTATVFTYSRAATMGLGLIAIAVLWKYRQRRGLWLSTALAGALALPLLPASIVARMETLNPAAVAGPAQSIGDASIRIRLNAYEAGVLMFLDHPLLGVGPGNYEANYLKYSARVGLTGEDAVRDPHSLPIQIAAETGVVGLMTFTALVWAAFALMERGRKRARDLGARSYADWIWSLELAVATYLFLSCFLHNAYFRHFWLLVALGASGASLALEAAASAARSRAARSRAAARAGGARLRAVRGQWMPRPETARRWTPPAA